MINIQSQPAMLHLPDHSWVVQVVQHDVQERFLAVARPPLRPAAFFCAVVPP